jgi:hypothetical protein
MNIFALSSDPAEAATFMCDSHVVKLCVETAQLLSTCAAIEVGPGMADAVSDMASRGLLYKPTHIHHPCVKWLSQSGANRAWLYAHNEQLAREYWLRYGEKRGKMHASWAISSRVRWYFKWLFDADWRDHTPFVRAMPEQLKSFSDDPVECYREYYRRDKAKFAKWTSPSSTPAWFGATAAE